MTASTAIGLQLISKKRSPWQNMPRDCKEKERHTHKMQCNVPNELIEEKTELYYKPIGKPMFLRERHLKR